MTKQKQATLFPNNRWLLAAILILPALLLYFKTLKFEFTSMDEQWMIVRNQTFFEKEANLKSIFSEAMGGEYYRPVLQLSFYLNYKLSGLSPASWHLFNLFLHLANVLLFFKLLTLLKTDRTLAAICTLLFSVHPVLLHAIAWVPGRNDMLLALFFLASVINLIRYLHQNKKIQLFYHLVFFAIALFTKENAVVLPFIFATFLFLNHPDSQARTKVLLVTLWTIILCSFLAIYFSILPDKAFTGVEKFTLSNFTGGFLIFTGKLILPIQLSVLPRLGNQSIWPGIITLAFITFLFFRPGFKNKKPVIAGLVIFFTTLVIPLWFGTVRGGEHYEQRLYLPLCGFLLMVGQLQIPINKKSVKLFTVALLLVYFVVGIVRMPLYRNKETFVTQAVKECPDFYLFNTQMGEMLCNKGRYSEALPYFNIADKLRPNSLYIYNVRGTAYYSLGEYNKAIEDFTHAIELSGFDERLYLNRCMAYLNAGMIIKAADDMVTLKKEGSVILPREVQEEIMQRLKSKGTY